MKIGRVDSRWFVTAFGEMYPLLYRHRDDVSAAGEIRSLVRLLDIPSGSPVLDICCGTGRHGRTLHRLGYHVWGMDLSLPLLERAACRDGLHGRLAAGDIRAIPFVPVFRAAFNLFTSFGYFLDEAENIRALEEMTRVLVPGGCLVIDHIHRDYLERRLVPESRETVSGLSVVQRRWLEGDRVIKNIEVTDREGCVREFREIVRMYRPGEFESMLRACGMTKIRVYGSFSGDPLISDSPRIIVIGEKPK